jgi:hypothetical protein
VMAKVRLNMRLEFVIFMFATNISCRIASIQPIPSFGLA